MESSAGFGFGLILPFIIYLWQIMPSCPCCSKYLRAYIQVNTYLLIYCGGWVNR